MIDDPLLIAELRRDEGVRYLPYLDTLGIQTVGVGHNLEAHPLPGMAYPMTDAQIDALLTDDLRAVLDEVVKRFPWAASMTQARQRALANMAFNLGISRLRVFKKMLTAMQLAHYQQAADEMLDSKWARQVGDRAKRLADMMAKG